MDLRRSRIFRSDMTAISTKALDVGEYVRVTEVRVSLESDSGRGKLEGINRPFEVFVRASQSARRSGISPKGW